MSKNSHSLLLHPTTAFLTAQPSPPLLPFIHALRDTTSSPGLVNLHPSYSESIPQSDMLRLRYGPYILYLQPPPPETEQKPLNPRNSAQSAHLASSSPQRLHNTPQAPHAIHTLKQLRPIGFPAGFTIHTTPDHAFTAATTHSRLVIACNVETYSQHLRLQPDPSMTSREKREIPSSSPNHPKTDQLTHDLHNFRANSAKKHQPSSHPPESIKHTWCPCCSEEMSKKHWYNVTTLHTDIDMHHNQFTFATNIEELLFATQYAYYQPFYYDYILQKLDLHGKSPRNDQSDKNEKDVKNEKKNRTEVGGVTSSHIVIPPSHLIPHLNRSFGYGDDLHTMPKIDLSAKRTGMGDGYGLTPKITVLDHWVSAQTSNSVSIPTDVRNAESNHANGPKSKLSHHSSKHLSPSFPHDSPHPPHPRLYPAIHQTHHLTQFSTTAPAHPPNFSPSDLHKSNSTTSQRDSSTFHAGSSSNVPDSSKYSNKQHVLIDSEYPNSSSPTTPLSSSTAQYEQSTAQSKVTKNVAFDESVSLLHLDFLCSLLLASGYDISATSTLRGNAPNNHKSARDDEEKNTKIVDDGQIKPFYIVDACWVPGHTPEDYQVMMMKHQARVDAKRKLLQQKQSKKHHFHQQYQHHSEMSSLHQKVSSRHGNGQKQSNSVTMSDGPIHHKGFHSILLILLSTGHILCFDPLSMAIIQIQHIHTTTNVLSFHNKTTGQSRHNRSVHYQSQSDLLHPDIAIGGVKMGGMTSSLIPHPSSHHNLISTFSPTNPLNPHCMQLSCLSTIIYPPSFLKISAMHYAHAYNQPIIFSITKEVNTVSWFKMDIPASIKITSSHGTHFYDIPAITADLSSKLAHIPTPQGSTPWPIISITLPQPPPLTLQIKQSIPHLLHHHTLTLLPIVLPPSKLLTAHLSALNPSNTSNTAPSQPHPSSSSLQTSSLGQHSSQFSTLTLQNFVNNSKAQHIALIQPNTRGYAIDSTTFHPTTSRPTKFSHLSNPPPDLQTTSNPPTAASHTSNTAHYNAQHSEDDEFFDIPPSSPETSSHQPLSHHDPSHKTSPNFPPSTDPSTQLSTHTSQQTTATGLFNRVSNSFAQSQSSLITPFPLDFIAINTQWQPLTHPATPMLIQFIQKNHPPSHQLSSPILSSHFLYTLQLTEHSTTMYNLAVKTTSFRRQIAKAIISLATSWWWGGSDHSSENDPVPDDVHIQLPLISTHFVNDTSANFQANAATQSGGIFGNFFTPKSAVSGGGMTTSSPFFSSSHIPPDHVVDMKAYSDVVTKINRSADSETESTGTSNTDISNSNVNFPANTIVNPAAPSSHNLDNLGDITHHMLYKSAFGNQPVRTWSEIQRRAICIKPLPTIPYIMVKREFLMPVVDNAVFTKKNEQTQTSDENVINSSDREYPDEIDDEDDHRLYKQQYISGNDAKGNKSDKATANVVKELSKTWYTPPHIPMEAINLVPVQFEFIEPLNATLQSLFMSTNLTYAQHITSFYRNRALKCGSDQNAVEYVNDNDFEKNRQINDVNRVVQNQQSQNQPQHYAARQLQQFFMKYNTNYIHPFISSSTLNRLAFLSLHQIYSFLLSQQETLQKQVYLASSQQQSHNSTVPLSALSTTLQSTRSSIVAITDNLNRIIVMDIDRMMILSMMKGLKSPTIAWSALIPISPIYQDLTLDPTTTTPSSSTSPFTNTIPSYGDHSNPILVVLSRGVVELYAFSLPSTQHTAITSITEMTTSGQSIDDAVDALHSIAPPNHLHFHPHPKPSKSNDKTDKTDKTVDKHNSINPTHSQSTQQQSLHSPPSLIKIGTAVLAEPSAQRAVVSTQFDDNGGWMLIDSYDESYPSPPPSTIQLYDSTTLQQSQMEYQMFKMETVLRNQINVQVDVVVGGGGGVHHSNCSDTQHQQQHQEQQLQNWFGIHDNTLQSFVLSNVQLLNSNGELWMISITLPSRATATSISQSE